MIYINFCCEYSHRDIPEDKRCNQMMPLNFDRYEETWSEMVEFAKSQGWQIIGGPEQITMKCYCPNHIKV